MRRKSKLSGILLVLTAILFVSSILFFVSKPRPMKDFNIYTSAFCEEQSNNILCKDKLVVQCGTLNYIIPETPTSYAIHKKDWIDPRIENLMK